MHKRNGIYLNSFQYRPKECRSCALQIRGSQKTICSLAPGSSLTAPIQYMTFRFNLVVIVSPLQMVQLCRPISRNNSCPYRELSDDYCRLLRHGTPLTASHNNLVHRDPLITVGI
jgi:hypothetical protein